MKLKQAILAAFLLASASTAAPVSAEAPVAETTAAKYNVKSTPLGTLLGDPSAKAVLSKYIPKLIENPDMAERASAMSLTEVADAVKAYAPDLLSEAVLSKIEADLAALPAR